MLRGVLLAAAVFLRTATAADDQVPKILSRVSEEAELFQSMAPQMFAQETLVQRTLSASRRLRPRVASPAAAAPNTEYRTREVVSEYGFSTLQDAPRALHEFRQLISVDGRRIAAEDAARRSLAAGIQTEDDRAKKRMLERFQKYGFQSAATDFGQLILLFTRRHLADYEFSYAGEGRIGADRATVLSFRQRGGAGGVLIVEERKAVREPLEGQLWVRASDALPLRITLKTRRAGKDGEIRDEAVVDYASTSQGVVAPASVVHREYAGPQLVAENVFRYSPFRLFSASSNVRFTEKPAAPK